MIHELSKITYSYGYVDSDGDYQDILYTANNNFIDYTDNGNIIKIVNCYLTELDLSRRLKQILYVELLGPRLF